MTVLLHTRWTRRESAVFIQIARGVEAVRAAAASLDRRLAAPAASFATVAKDLLRIACMRTSGEDVDAARPRVMVRTRFAVATGRRDWPAYSGPSSF